MGQIWAKKNMKNKKKTGKQNCADKQTASKSQQTMGPRADCRWLLMRDI